MSDRLQFVANFVSILVASKERHRQTEVCRITTLLLRQKLQYVRAVIGEVTDDDYCAGQNDGRVNAHETNLHVTNSLPKVDDGPPETVNETVDDTKIEHLPQAFARNDQNRLDHGGIINLVNVVL